MNHIKIEPLTAMMLCEAVKAVDLLARLGSAERLTAELRLKIVEAKKLHGAAQWMHECLYGPVPSELDFPEAEIPF